MVFGAVDRSSLQNGFLQQQVAWIFTGITRLSISGTATCFTEFNVFRRGSHLYGFVGVHSMDVRMDDVNRISISNSIDTVILHPNWNRTTRIADIALVRLKTDIVYTSIKYCIFMLQNDSQFLLYSTIDYTRPICLSKSTDPTSGAVTLTGWGTINGF